MGKLNNLMMEIESLHVRIDNVLMGDPKDKSYNKELHATLTRRLLHYENKLRGLGKTALIVSVILSNERVILLTGLTVREVKEIFPLLFPNERALGYQQITPGDIISGHLHL